MNPTCAAWRAERGRAGQGKGSSYPEASLAWLHRRHHHPHLRQNRVGTRGKRRKSQWGGVGREAGRRFWSFGAWFCFLALQPHSIGPPRTRLGTREPQQSRPPSLARVKRPRTRPCRRTSDSAFQSRTQLLSMTSDQNGHCAPLVYIKGQVWILKYCKAFNATKIESCRRWDVRHLPRFLHVLKVRVQFLSHLPGRCLSASPATALYEHNYLFQFAASTPLSPTTGTKKAFIVSGQKQK